MEATVNAPMKRRGRPPLNPLLVKKDARGSLTRSDYEKLIAKYGTVTAALEFALKSAQNEPKS